MDYTQLDILHKRQLLINSRTFRNAVQALNKETDVNEQFWISTIHYDAQKFADSLTDDDVNQVIADMEKQIPKSNLDGKVIVVNIRKNKN